jgi:hypothetical protein
VPPKKYVLQSFERRNVFVQPIKSRDAENTITIVFGKILRCLIAASFFNLCHKD